jgi:ABC-type multidrug transport system ATPase subunit
MSLPAIVQTKNLSRFYQNQPAIKNLRFNLKPGKPTTMQILTGNLAASEGQVITNGSILLNCLGPSP